MILTFAATKKSTDSVDKGSLPNRQKAKKRESIGKVRECWWCWGTKLAYRRLLAWIHGGKIMWRYPGSFKTQNLTALGAWCYGLRSRSGGEIPVTTRGSGFLAAFVRKVAPLLAYSPIVCQMLPIIVRRRKVKCTVRWESRKGVRRLDVLWEEFWMNCRASADRTLALMCLFCACKVARVSHGPKGHPEEILSAD